MKLKQSFPALGSGFYDIFMDRIKDNGFSDERLTDAVNHVVDTCIYPQPTIAQFLNFDVRIKIYNYSEYVQFVTENRNPDSMKAVRIAGKEKPMFAKIEDIEKYKLELWS